MTNGPLVSIIIPLHNRAGELPQTLDSVRAQTYPHWEAVVVDDHSSDDGPAVVEAAAREDSRIKLLRLPDGRTGGPAGRNFGAEHSAGQFVIFLDSDDLLAPFALEQRVRVMREKPNLGFAVFASQLFRDAAGDIPLLWNCFNETDDLDRFLARECVWQTTGPIWRRGALATVGPWDETILSGQDWEYHCRALLATKRGALAYDKFGRDEGFPAADMFWRVAGPDRASIGRSALGEGHARARFKLLDELLEKVRAAGELTPARELVFGALYWEAVGVFADRFHRGEARRMWRGVCRSTGLFTRAQALAGHAHLALGRSATYRRRMGDAMLRRAWPAEMFFRKSPTYLATPADPSRPPTVSLLLVASGRLPWIGKALRGVHRQREQDYELVVVDAGAAPKAIALVRRAADQDRRIRVLTLPAQQRRMAGAGLALALAESRGGLIARLDPADVSTEDRLLRQVAHLRAHPECVAVGGQVQWTDAAGNAGGRSELEADPGAARPVATLFRRSAVDRAGGFRAAAPADPDPELFRRLAKVGPLATLPEAVIESRRPPPATRAISYPSQAAPTVRRSPPKLLAPAVSDESH